MASHALLPALTHSQFLATFLPAISLLEVMPDPCWTCSDNHMDDMVYTEIVYGGNIDAWLPQYNATETALYPREGERSITLCKGSGGTAELDFLGQQVAVYGPEFNTATKSSYSIDGKVLYIRTAQGVGVGVRLFQSDILPAGTHTLVIDVVEAGEDTPFALDWIEYNVTARGAPQSSTSSSAYSQPQDPSSSTSSVASTSGASGAAKASVSIPAIAGGVVGGLVGLIGIILAYMTLRSRRKWRDRTRRNTEYSYGEVAQYDSDTLAVMAPELGVLPNITVTGAEDISTMSGFTGGTASASSRQSARAGSRDCTVEPEHFKHSESPPAYTP